ncbi:unnamed protein product [Closterium sp. Naga37s-1]|nr:unnamed protein product [Closterium sp. Naga37s-1]
MEPGGGGRGRGRKGARGGRSGGGARGRRGSARGEAVGAVAEGTAGAWWAIGGGAEGGYADGGEAGRIAARGTGWGVGEGAEVGASVRGAAVAAREGGGTGGGVGAVGGGGEAANAAEGWTGGGAEGRVSRRRGGRGRGAECGAGGSTVRASEGAGRGRTGGGTGQADGSRGRGVVARRGRGAGVARGQDWTGTGAHARGNARMRGGDAGRGWDADGGMGYLDGRVSGGEALGAAGWQQGRVDWEEYGGVARGRRVEMAWGGDGEEEGERWDGGGEESNARQQMVGAGRMHRDQLLPHPQHQQQQQQRPEEEEEQWQQQQQHLQQQRQYEQQEQLEGRGGEEQFRGAAGGWVEGGRQQAWRFGGGVGGGGVGGGGEELGRTDVGVGVDRGGDGAWGEWYEGEGGGAAEEEWEGDGGEEWGGGGGEEWGGEGGEGEEDYEVGYAAGLAAAREALRQASAANAAAGAGVGAGGVAVGGAASRGGAEWAAGGAAGGGMDLMLPHHPPAAAPRSAAAALHTPDASQVPTAAAATAGGGGAAGGGAGEQEEAGGGGGSRRRGGGGGGGGGGSRSGRRKHVDVSVKRDICELRRLRPGITVGGIMRVCRAKYPHMRLIPSHVRRILNKAPHWSSTLAQRSSKRVRAPESMALEEALVAWLRDMKGGPGATKVQLQQICAKGRQLGLSFGVSPSFRYSIGWACRFQERWGFSKRHLEEEREAYFNDAPATAAAAAACSAEPSLVELADEIFGAQILVARTDGDDAEGEGEWEEGEEGDEEGSEEDDEDEGEEDGRGGGGRGGRGGRRGRGGRGGRGVVGRGRGRGGAWKGGMRVVGRETSLTAGREVIDLEGGEGGERVEGGERGDRPQRRRRGEGGSEEQTQQGREQAGGGAGEEGDGGEAAAEAGGWAGGVDLLAGTARGAARDRARKKAAGKAAHLVQPSRELLALALAEAGVDGEQAGGGMQGAGGCDSDDVARTLAAEGIRRAAAPAGAAWQQQETSAWTPDASGGHAHGGDGGRRHVEWQRAAGREKQAPGGKGKHRAAISLRVKRVICMLRAARPDMPPKDIHRLMHRAFAAAARHPQGTALPSAASATAAAGRAANLAAGGVAAAGVEAAGVAALDVAAVRRILRKSHVYLALPAHSATLIRHSSGAYPQVQAAVAAWVRTMEARYGREALRWDDILDYARQVGPQMGVKEGFRYSYHWARKALLRHGLGSNWGKQVERGGGKKKGKERGDGGEMSIDGRAAGGEEQQEGPLDRLQRLAEQWAAEARTAGQAHGHTGEGAGGRQRRWRHTVVPPAVKLAMCALARTLPSLPSKAIARAVGARYGMRLTNVSLPAVLLREDDWRQLVQRSHTGRPGAVRLRGAESRLEEALALAVRKAIARMEEDRPAAGGERGGEGGSRGGPGAEQQQVSVRAVQEYARRVAPLVGVGRGFTCSVGWVQQFMQRWGFHPPGGTAGGGGGARGRGGRLGGTEDEFEEGGGEEGEESEGQGGVSARIRGILDERCEVRQEEVAALVALAEEQRERRAQIKASGRRLTDVREEEWIEEGRHDGAGGRGRAAGDGMESDGGDGGVTGDSDGALDHPAGFTGRRAGGIAQAAPQLQCAWAALAAATPFPRQLTAHRAAEVGRAWHRLERTRVVVWEGGAGSESSESMSVEEIGGMGSSTEEWESKEGIVGEVGGRSAGGCKPGERGRKRRRSGDEQDGVVASWAGAAAAGSGAGMAARGAAGGGQLAGGGQVSAGMAAPLLAPDLIVAAALRAALGPHPMPAPPAAHALRFPFPHAAPPATTALHSLAQLLASAGLPSGLLPVARPYGPAWGQQLLTAPPPSSHLAPSLPTPPPPRSLTALLTSITSNQPPPFTTPAPAPTNASMAARAAATEPRAAAAARARIHKRALCQRTALAARAPHQPTATAAHAHPASRTHVQHPHAPLARARPTSRRHVQPSHAPLASARPASTPPAH